MVVVLSIDESAITPVAEAFGDIIRAADAVLERVVQLDAGCAVTIAALPDEADETLN